MNLGRILSRCFRPRNQQVKHACTVTTAGAAAANLSLAGSRPPAYGYALKLVGSLFPSDQLLALTVPYLSHFLDVTFNGAILLQGWKHCASQHLDGPEVANATARGCRPTLATRWYCRFSLVKELDGKPHFPVASAFEGILRHFPSRHKKRLGSTPLGHGQFTKGFGGWVGGPEGSGMYSDNVRPS